MSKPFILEELQNKSQKVHSHAFDTILDKYRDARGEGNKPPSWYQGKGVVVELATVGEIIEGGEDVICTLITYSAWSDCTATFYQEIIANDGAIPMKFLRNSISDETWGYPIWTNSSDADTLDGKHATDFVNLVGGAVNGSLKFYTPNANAENGIEGGNADAASFDGCNVDLFSWNGIGFYPTAGGQWGNGKSGRSVVIDPRSGYVKARGGMEIQGRDVLTEINELKNNLTELRATPKGDFVGKKIKHYRPSHSGNTNGNYVEFFRLDASGTDNIFSLMCREQSTGGEIAMYVDGVLFAQGQAIQIFGMVDTNDRHSSGMTINIPFGSNVIMQRSVNWASTSYVDFVGVHYYK